MQRLMLLIVGTAALVILLLIAGYWYIYLAHKPVTAQAGSPASDQTGAPADKDFTPWMSHAELDDYLKQFDTNPPGGHPNYWDKGHWINAVEGRWQDGIPQYRISYGDAANDHYYTWYWYLNQDQLSYSYHVHEFADKGFVLLDPNSFLRPDDTRRYQGVWHLIGPKKTDSPAAPVAQTNAVPATPPPPSAAAGTHSN